MTFTTADLDALKAALISGATEVSIGERRIKYKSTSEIIETIKLVEKSLAGSSAAVSTNIPATYTKGQR